MPCLFLSGCNSEDHCKKSTKCQKDGKTNIYYPGSVCWKQPSEIRTSSCTTLRRRITRYFLDLYMSVHLVLIDLVVRHSYTRQVHINHLAGY